MSAREKSPPAVDSHGRQIRNGGKLPNGDMPDAGQKAVPEQTNPCATEREATAAGMIKISTADRKPATAIAEPTGVCAAAIKTAAAGSTTDGVAGAAKYYGAQPKRMTTIAESTDICTTAHRAKSAAEPFAFCGSDGETAAAKQSDNRASAEKTVNFVTMKLSEACKSAGKPVNSERPNPAEACKVSGKPVNSEMAESSETSKAAEKTVNPERAEPSEACITSIRRLTPDSLTPPWQMAGLPPQTPVLLALSGGADSRALLHLLSACAARDGFSILLAHVHHGIRGEEADRDAAFCRSLSEQYGWELEMLRADVPELARRRRRGLEETAREVRYGFFEKLMRERDIPLLATAHHADDQLETMLFRLCRGSGLAGLCGIPPVRKFAGGFLTRPLLPFSRREILAFCKREGLTYVSDSTNLDSAYARNRIRLRVVPELETVVSDPQGGAYRLSRSLAQDRDFLDRTAEAFLAEHLRDGSLPVEALRREHPAIRRRALAALSPVPLDAAHLETMERLVLEGISGSSCSLPANRRACVQQGMVSVWPVLRKPALSDPVPLREGRFEFCDGCLTVCVTKIENLKQKTKVHNLSTPRYIIVNENSDIMLGNGYWRCRKEGDTLTVHGIHRKLRRLLREAGVPPALRDALPLLCDREGILWVPFVGARDGYGSAAAENIATGTYWQVELLHPERNPEQKGLL